MAINIMAEKMLRVSDASRMLHIRPNTLRRWSKMGVVEAYRIGVRGELRFRQSDLASFINNFNPYKQNEY